MYKFLYKPFVIIAILGVVIVSIVWYWRLSREEIPEFIVAKRTDLFEEVSATGRVQPAESVHLAFDRSGRVSHILVKIGKTVLAGQVLVEIESADLLAQLLEAEANAKANAAKLDEIKRGTRQEEVVVQAAKVNDARQILAARVQDSYTKSDDAIRNRVDQFLSNPRSSSPTLNFTTADSKLKSDIERQRVDLESLLNLWKDSLKNIELTVQLSEFTDNAKTNLHFVKSFLDKAATAVNSATPSASLSQATLDGYKTDVSTGRNNIETAIFNLTSADSNLLIQEEELALKKAGPLPEKIFAQEAAYEEALARVGSVKAQLKKTIILSPIKGVVSAVDVKVGEIVSSNTPVVSVIAVYPLQIEVNIPEADVSRIKTGLKANITLDAYGNDIVFGAEIVSIDPSETMVEGVATYKTTLQFSQKDDRIKPGMTANIDMITGRRAGVISIPQRLIFSRNGYKAVKVYLDGKIEERAVNTGIRGSSGNVEITEGLKEEERVVVPE